MKKLLNIVLSLALLSSFALTAMAIEYGGIGGKPAYPDPDNERSESIFVHTLSAGDNQEEGVAVINNTDSEKTIRVYATDSAISTGGAFTCEQESQEKDGVGTWIELEKEEVTVPAGSNEVVAFHIKVPENAEIGEHNGCIVIQEVVSEEGNGVEGDQAGVNISMRTAIRLLITIPGEIVKKIEIPMFAVEKHEDGGKYVKLQIKNNGNVSVDTGVTIITKNLMGKVLHTYESEVPVIKNEVTDVNMDLIKPFWGGIYKLKYVITYENADLAEREISIFILPSWKGLIIEIAILLAILFVIFLFFHRSKDIKEVQSSWINYTVQNGDDIQNLAKSRNIDWKKLAKANNLKPPYGLTEGQEIKLPPAEEK